MIMEVFCLFVYFCSFCFLHHHRLALPGVGILGNCLRLTGKHCSLAVSTRTFPSCFSFLFLTIKGCLEFMGIILYKGNNEINESCFQNKVLTVQLPYLPNTGVSSGCQYGHAFATTTPTARSHFSGLWCLQDRQPSFSDKQKCLILL